MNEMRYLVDENTARALGDQLRRRQPTINVIYVGDELAPSLGTPDPDILLRLERESYYLTRIKSEPNGLSTPVFLLIMQELTRLGPHYT